MALYSLKNGLFTLLPPSGGEFLISRVIKSAALEETLGAVGFYLHDDVSGVYRVFRRGAGPAPVGWMPAVYWVFAVQTHDDGLDFILVEESLPDYLAALRELKVLADRAAVLTYKVRSDLDVKS